MVLFNLINYDTAIYMHCQFSVAVTVTLSQLPHEMAHLYVL